MTEGATSLIDGVTRAVGKPLSSRMTHRISAVSLFLLTGGDGVEPQRAAHH